MPDETQDIGRNLATLLRRLLDEKRIASDQQARWLTDNIGVNKSSATDLLRDRRSGFLRPDSYLALQASFPELGGMPFVEATAADIGIVWGQTNRAAAWWVPAWFDELPDDEKALVRQLILALGRAHGLTE